MLFKNVFTGFNTRNLCAHVTYFTSIYLETGISGFALRLILHKKTMYKYSFSYRLKTALAALAFLLMTLVSGAQAQKSMDELQKKVQESQRRLDSITQKSDRMFKEMADSINAANMIKSTERSYEWLNQYQKEKKRKEKQKAMMYIFFGIAMLGVLVYGLSRRRKNIS